jgi:hypothetical protein
VAEHGMAGACPRCTVLPGSLAVATGSGRSLASGKSWATGFGSKESRCLEVWLERNSLQRSGRTSLSL